MKEAIKDILHLNEKSKLSMGLQWLIRDTFQICLAIPIKPPIIMSKCCKSVIGCEVSSLTSFTFDPIWEILMAVSSFALLGVGSSLSESMDTILFWHFLLWILPSLIETAKTSCLGGFQNLSPVMNKIAQVCYHVMQTRVSNLDHLSPSVREDLADVTIHELVGFWLFC